MESDPLTLAAVAAAASEEEPSDDDGGGEEMVSIHLDQPSPEDRAWTRALRIQEDDMSASLVAKEVRTGLASAPEDEPWRSCLDNELTEDEYRRLKLYLRLRLEHVGLELSANKEPVEGMPGRYRTNLTVYRPGQRKMTKRARKTIVIGLLIIVLALGAYVFFIVVTDRPKAAHHKG